MPLTAATPHPQQHSRQHLQQQQHNDEEIRFRLPFESI
jgi:hypothetical protein